MSLASLLMIIDVVSVRDAASDPSISLLYSAA